MYQKEFIFFDIDEIPPSLEYRKAFLDPNCKYSPYHGFIGNAKAVRKLTRLDVAALGRFNHCCNDLNVALIGRAGCGKAQPLDSIFYTPSGVKMMKDVVVGDKVCTPDGGIASVTGVFPQGKREIFCITFTDGTRTECCKDHLWFVNNLKWNQGKIVDTNYIIDNLSTPKGKRKLSIPVTIPVNFDERKINVNPYLLGVLLGDGNLSNRSNLRFSTKDQEIVEKVQALLPEGYSLKKSPFPRCDYRISKIKRNNFPNVIFEAIKAYGLSGVLSNNKFIPEDYLYNSVSNRLEILQGLMDTDGYVNKKGGVYYYSTSIKLAESVKFLVESLGGLCRLKEKYPTFTHKGIKKAGQKCYVCSISFNNPELLFSLKRKKQLCSKRTKYPCKRMIKSVELIGIKECQCIMIDHPSHLYLTNNFIVTHNTELVRRHTKANGLPLVEIHPKAIKEVHDIFLEIQRVCELNEIPLYAEEEEGYVIPPINLFIDEVHALSTGIVQALLKATEPKDCKLVTEYGTILDCSLIHWIIATTDRGKLFDAFDTRFSKIHISMYSKEEIAQIVKNNYPHWDMVPCNLVAHYCSRIPREALAFAKEMELEYSMQTGKTWNEVAATVAADNEIDEFGMTFARLNVLKALLNRPISARRLPVIIGVKVEELENFILPWLLESTIDSDPLVTVTGKGYTITEAGLKELNKRNIRKSNV